MPVRVECHFFGALGAVGKEKTHETRNQDRDPDCRNSGHIPRSRRSSGSSHGRRPDSCVPTQTTELPHQPATAVEPEAAGDRKVTKVTWGNLGRPMRARNIWADGIHTNPPAPLFWS